MLTMNCGNLRLFFSIGLCLVCLLAISPSEIVANEVDFEKDIWPILQSRCNSCHGEEIDEGRLRLDAKQAFKSGGVSGKLVDEKNVDRSLLLVRLLGQDDQDRMPLDEDPLSDKQIQLIRKWLSSGAAWPDHIGKVVQAKKIHWAYQKPIRPVPPSSESSWPVNAIDHFVLNRMKEKGLSPAPIAPRGKLLRRVYLDLIGMPPTLEELHQFLDDKSENAYEQVVDRLLASPKFGEKWARSWLDLARYADTNGFQADQFRSVWPYRDWVIDSINRDLPFDQFTIEQLAGDLIPNATVEQKIATGFHRLTTCNVEAGVDPEQNRVNQVIDRINTTGTVWFGTTFECMQCHNHKYDPFTQREYYEMFAFFNNTPLEVKNSGNNIQYEFYGPKMELPLSREIKQSLEAADKDIEACQLEMREFEKGSKEAFDKWLIRVRANPELGEIWTPLKVVKFESQGGAGHRILNDQSVLLVGKNPPKDTYILVVESDLPTINGFRFETLTHDSLPGKGPGRHAVAGRPNFVLQEIVATLPDQENRKLKLVSPVADFAQKNYPASGLFDGNPRTGWAIAAEFGQDHFVTALTDKPIESNSNKYRIQFRFDQNLGGGRNVGRLRVSALTGARSNSNLPAETRKLVRKKVLTESQKIRLLKHFLLQNRDYKQLKTKLANAQKKKESIKPNSTLVMIESQMRESTVFKRGNFLDKGQKVTPSTPAILHNSGDKQPGNRLDFAKWIVDANNPLTARVVVNRWWQEIFGRGIVVTSEDFGTQGEPPSHPRLLDWLAIELIQTGWSRKSLIKQIVLSRTYQQSSSFDPIKSKTDPLNTFLARGPRFRMSAETIRDNYLVVANVLAAKQGGPPVFPPQPEGIWRHVGRNAPKYNTSQGTDRFRRGLYVFWRRSAPYPSFVNFDAPDRASCVVKRSTTNTPLQALTLLNDQSFYEMARLVAIETIEKTTDLKQKLSDVFESCTMRKPDKSELDYMVTFLETRKKFYQQNVAQAREVAGQPNSSVEVATWINVIQVLFNLDETITKD